MSEGKSVEIDSSGEAMATPPHIQGAAYSWEYDNPILALQIRSFLAHWGSWEEADLLRALAATNDLPDRAFTGKAPLSIPDLEAVFSHFISIYGLGWHGTASARDALAAQLASEHVAPETRWACALALGLTHDDRAAPQLERMLIEPYPIHPRDAALQPPPARWDRGMAVVDDLDIGHPDDVDSGRRLYDDDRTGERIQAARLLAEGGHTASIPALRSALQVALASEVYDYQLGMFAFHGHWTGFFEPALVYCLGQLGAVGALTGLDGVEGDIPRDGQGWVAGTQGRLRLWRVHLTLGSLRAHTLILGDMNGQQPQSLWRHSPQLHVEARERLESVFGLSRAESERDLAAYDRDLISTQIWRDHLDTTWRGRLAAQLGRSA